MIQTPNRLSFLITLLVILPLSLAAQEFSPEQEAARKAADPLADVRAIMTDNTFGFDAGANENDTTYGVQIQPVYAIPNETKFNMIARAIIPIIGVESGVVVPPIGPGPRPDEGSTWGLSDSIAQFFISPKTDGSVKFGVGPQVSLKTQTSDRVAGAGWGGGLAAVVFTGSGQWSVGALVMQHWGENSDFSTFTFQPIVMYMLPWIPGAYVGYNNAITCNWKAESGQMLTVPLGLTAGKTLVLQGGRALDLSVGAYPLVERPDGAPSWQFKFGASLFFN